MKRKKGETSFLAALSHWGAMMEVHSSSKYHLFNQATLHYTTLHYTTLHYTTLHMIIAKRPRSDLRPGHYLPQIMGNQWSEILSLK